MTHSQAAGFSQQFLSTIMSLPTTTMVFLDSPQPVWVFAVLIYYTNKFTNNKKYQMLVSVTQQKTVEPRKIPNEKGTFQSLSIWNPRVFVIHTAINLSHLARRLNHLDKQFKTRSKLSHSKKPSMVFITWARKGWRSRVSAGLLMLKPNWWVHWTHWTLQTQEDSFLSHISKFKFRSTHHFSTLGFRFGYSWTVARELATDKFNIQTLGSVQRIMQTTRRPLCCWPLNLKFHKAFI